MNAAENFTTIDWKNDSINTVRARIELQKFIESQVEDQKFPKWAAYNERRIKELIDEIKENRSYENR